MILKEQGKRNNDHARPRDTTVSACNVKQGHIMDHGAHEPHSPFYFYNDHMDMAGKAESPSPSSRGRARAWGVELRLGWLWVWGVGSGGLELGLGLG